MKTSIVSSIYKCGLCVLMDLDPLNPNEGHQDFQLFEDRQRVLRIRACRDCLYQSVLYSSRLISYLYRHNMRCSHVRRRGRIVCRICHKVIVNAAVSHCVFEDASCTSNTYNGVHV